MTESYLIDGVGDEVTVVLGIFLAIFVVVVSWMSTRVSDGDTRQYDINITANAAAEIADSGQSQQVTPSTEASGPPQDYQSTSAVQSTDANALAGDLLPGTSSDASAESTSEQVTSTNEAAAPDTDSNVLRQRFAAESAENPLPSGAADVTPEGTPSTSSTTEGSVPVRLKFMDDTTRTVHARPNDTLENFRRQHLPAETVHRYRLIYQGQVLRDGTQTLRQLRVIPESNQNSESVPVVHCFLSPASTTNAGNLATSASHQLEMVAEELHIGSLLLPLLGLALACLWYLCIFHTSLFSIQSVVSIVGFTFLYIALVANQFLL